MLEDGVQQRADPVPNADGPCRRRAPGGLAPARHSVEQVAGAAARCPLPYRRRGRGDSPSRPRPPATRAKSRRASGKERRAGRRREAEARHAAWWPAHSDLGIGMRFGGEPRTADGCGGDKSLGEAETGEAVGERRSGGRWPVGGEDLTTVRLKTQNVAEKEAMKNLSTLGIRLLFLNK